MVLVATFYWGLGYENSGLCLRSEIKFSLCPQILPANEPRNFSIEKGNIFTTLKNIDLSKLKSFADDNLTHSHTMTPFDAPGKQAF